MGCVAGIEFGDHMRASSSIRFSRLPHALRLSVLIDRGLRVLLFIGRRGTGSHVIR